MIGYPAGLGILVAAALIPFGTTTLPGDVLFWRGVFAFCGLGTLLWTWAVDRRRRIEVTEQTLTAVNTTSWYEVPWRNPTTSRSPPWNGSTDTTTAGPTKPSTTSHPSPSKPCITLT